jgi:hypothetical protein
MPAASTLQTFSPQFNTLGQNKIADATTQGDQTIAQSAGSGGCGAGSILGGIGSLAKGIGSIFGFLAEGGAVGAQIPTPKDPRIALVEGYLTGALHQRDFGGSPNTLAQAASQVRDHLAKMCGGGPVGMASGGTIDPSQLASQAISSALGLNQSQPTPSLANPEAAPNVQNSPLAEKTVSPAAQPNAPANYVPQQQQQQAQAQPDQSQQSPVANIGANQNPSMCNPQGLQQCAPSPQQQYLTQSFAAGACTPQPATQAAKGGFMEKMAAGGCAAQQNLKPGQAFQGDGSVNGPGGPTDDVIPAKLSNGEFVMSAAATQYWGVDELAKMNDKGKQGFMSRVQQVDNNQQQGPGANAAPQLPAQGCQPMVASGGPMMKQQPTKGTMRPRGNNAFMGI